MNTSNITPTYRITIGTKLNESWSDWFDNYLIIKESDCQTVIEAQFVDQAALYGMLLRIRDLGIPLVSVTSLSPELIKRRPIMQTKFFERPEGKLAYTDYGGDGELVIMLPGMGAIRSEYRFLAPTVRDAGFHVVTVDLRGQGESSAFWSDYEMPSSGQDILALIDSFDEGPAHVIGTSYSPGAAVWATAEKPEMVRSLVLIGAFVRDPKPTFIQNLMMFALFAGPWKYAGWRSYYKTIYPSQKPDDFDAYLDQLMASLHEPGKFDAFQQLAASTRIESERRLSKIHAPALVVMGTKDPDWSDPIAEAHWIGEQLNVEPVFIDGAGHYPQTEMPDITNPQIVQFLKQVN